ncbi:hypothetical protein GCM10009530_49430 [Microbispora corallina]|uniref:Uncharacterized protein n=1 Tax=Microbispora corallina TaxID=83302 RepID=A0ABQ4FQM4_9ACTN|nr:hypothetical protein [Microbispora corallina]GIH37106.1 hypothetical protein Mco01_01060 [Microbispora corallina]
MTKRKRRSSAPAPRWTGSALSEWGLSERNQRILVWTGSVVAVLAVALVLTLLVNVFAGGQAAPVPESGGGVIGQGRPSAYQAWPSVKEFAPIADRRADARPLTAQEVFGARTLTAGKVTLRRVAAHLDSGCAGAVWGADVVDALNGAGCTQALRGLYATQDGAYVAEYTMFNLADEKSANTLVQSLGTLYRGGWTLPLESPKAAFGAYTEGSGQAMGHYAGVVWIGRSDGAEPGEKDDFVMLGLAAREVEKALYRRVVDVAGVPTAPVKPGSGDDTAQPSEAAPSEPGAGPSPSPSGAVPSGSLAPQ